MRKQIIATVSDDCSWKIWNMDTGENIMTGEGHKDWLAGVDFHPVGSHLVTAGSDNCIKLGISLIPLFPTLSKALILVLSGKLNSMTLETLFFLDLVMALSNSGISTVLR